MSSDAQIMHFTNTRETRRDFAVPIDTGITDMVVTRHNLGRNTEGEGAGVECEIIGVGGGSG